MKKKLLFFVIAIATLACIFTVQAFAACDPACTTDFACYDADGKCNTCGEAVTITAQHTLDKVCKDADGNCNVCSQSVTPSAHTWSGDCDLACDVCSEARTSETSHKYSTCQDATCDVCGAERDVTSLSCSYADACTIACSVCGNKRTPDNYAEGNWTVGDDFDITDTPDGEEPKFSVTHSEIDNWWPRTNIKFLTDGDYNTGMITAPTGEQVTYTFTLNEVYFISKVKISFNGGASLSNGQTFTDGYNCNLEIVVKCFDINGNEVSAETFSADALLEKEITVEKGVKSITVYPKSRWDVHQVIREVDIYSSEPQLIHTGDRACYDADGRCNLCAKAITVAGAHTLDYACYDSDNKCNICNQTALPQISHVTDYPCFDADGKCSVCLQTPVLEVCTYGGGICDPICDICSKTRENAPAHTTDKACADADNKCNICGSAVSLEKHTYTGDCDTECDVCSGTRKSGVAHTVDMACKDADGKCSACGTVVALADHTYKGDCDTVCSVCSDTRTIDAEHTFEEDWTETVAPTEEKEGEKTRTCTVCGFVEKEAIPALEKADEGGLGAGVIIAIVVGAVAVLGGGGFCLYWFVLRKKY
ncbi:MAG: hypothetical protein J6A54_03985 [Clostridia bacterium]|nr:hypothetical protein [Clostridia bacterium]